MEQESTAVLEINFRRLLLACESKHREVERSQLYDNANTTSTTTMKRQRPHPIPVMRNQLESLEAMLTELQSRTRARAATLQQDHPPATTQHKEEVTKELKNFQSLTKRVTIITERWRGCVVEADRAEAELRSPSSALSGGGMRIRSATSSPAFFISPTKVAAVSEQVGTPPRLKKFTQEFTPALLKPSVISMPSVIGGRRRQQQEQQQQQQRGGTGMEAASKRRGKKKLTIKQELSSWQRQLGLVDDGGGAKERKSCTTTEGSGGNGDDERQRMEDATERNLEEILETTTTLKSVVQASKSKIQEDLVRIEETTEMASKNQVAVEKNIKQTKKQSKAVWSDIFTEMKMAMAAIVMTFIIVVITRVPFLNLFFLKNF